MKYFALFRAISKWFEEGYTFLGLILTLIISAVVGVVIGFIVAVVAREFFDCDFEDAFKAGTVVGGILSFLLIFFA